MPFSRKTQLEFGAFAKDGRIVIPAFQVPGLTVTAVSVVLTGSMEELLSPTPDAAAMDFKRLSAR